MLIPMADNYNHANVNVCPYIVNKNLHSICDTNSKYFTPDKFKNDYSKVFRRDTNGASLGPRFFDEGKFQ